MLRMGDEAAAELAMDMLGCATHVNPLMFPAFAARGNLYLKQRNYAQVLPEPRPHS